MAIGTVQIIDGHEVIGVEDIKEQNCFGCVFKPHGGERCAKQQWHVGQAKLISEGKTHGEDKLTCGEHDHIYIANTEAARRRYEERVVWFKLTGELEWGTSSTTGDMMEKGELK